MESKTSRQRIIKTSSTKSETPAEQTKSTEKLVLKEDIRSLNIEWKAEKEAQQTKAMMKYFYKIYEQKYLKMIQNL